MKNTLSIDPDSLRLLIAKSGKTAAELSRNINYGGNYLSACCFNKKISIDAAKGLKKLYKFNPRKYIIDDNIDAVFDRKRCQKKSEDNQDPNSQDSFYIMLKAINCAISAYLNNIEKGDA